MKQKKHGQKVQNWHRPLGSQHLGRWFRRHRHDDIPDDGWDGQGWGAARSSENDIQDLRHLELQQLLREIVHLPPPLFRREWAVDAALFAEVESAFILDRGQPAERLEQRLAAFIQSLRHFPNSPAMLNLICDAIGDDIYREVLQATPQLKDGRILLQNLCLFAPFWIRSPRTWTPGSKKSLIDHVLVRYEVPRFLYPEWSNLPGFPMLKWLSWFVLFAQGGSLRRAAGLFRWNLPSRFEHSLRTASESATPNEACAFAQIVALGGSPTDCRRILSNPAFVVDTTAPTESESLTEFWTATVRWIIAHRTAITDEQCEGILSWAMHEYTETDRRGAPPFLWKGRGPRSVLQRSLDYQRQLELPWFGHRWQRHGWDWEPVGTSLDGWRFVELTSGEELFREGQALRHCVAGYAARCADGHSAIVSVRYNEARRLTVEIAPATGQVVQAKGVCNRSATTDEQRAIRLWLDTVLRPNLAGHRAPVREVQ